MPVSRLAPCVITASAIEQKEGGIWIWIWIWKRIWIWIWIWNWKLELLELDQFMMRLTKATTFEKNARRRRSYVVLRGARTRCCFFFCYFRCCCRVASAARCPLLKLFRFSRSQGQVAGTLRVFRLEALLRGLPQADLQKVRH